MVYKKYRYENLKKLCNVVFEKFGFDEEDSETITDVLLLSDLFGIESHGIQRLSKYYKEIKNGLIKVNSKIKVIKETQISTVIDANESIGQIVSKKAMNMAIEKAKSSGIGIVLVNNSNHYGIAGYYAKMAEKEGLLGISMTNSPAITVPIFGREAMMGSNPIAIAMPATPHSFLMDMSTSVVTRGKIEVYNKRNEKLPVGWTLDSKGEDAFSAQEVLYNIANKKGGGIVPLGGAKEMLGGHKGYGFALAVELFTAILSGGLTANYVHVGGVSGTCHSFIAVDYGIFGDKKIVENNFSKYLQEIRQSKKAQGAHRIYIHGEKEAEAYNDRIKNGIPMNDNTLKEIEEICKNFKLDIKDYI
ncbi:malate dehydrogenase (NAD) [Clostridium acidisoli DSM 12555]|uniref:Malate dehydrogenase (NAD) n=1 Tax=Clostridium acidisoli DSM 12555 TaxID=1121291 RepID=A0A1W1WWP6_9CLOT|nr:Ldh family oxidoreductase [Clostridium acidisoli]SMC16054.1 malate dehydrogenase (NAD) [Clostridium acidisoli DSM 12555]